jgi:transposase
MNARKLDHKTLTELRTLRIESVQAGNSPEALAIVMGISRATIYNWISLYRHGGWQALDPKQACFGTALGKMAPRESL